MRRCRYPSDTTDAEWFLLEPLLPVPACQTPTGGRPEAHPRREVVDALRYVLDTGCKWRALPADFPPFTTVWGFFDRWSAAGIFNRIRDQLRRRVRKAMGKQPHAVACVIDSQSVRVASNVPKATSGYDPGKKLPGRKRHIVVDTRDLLLFVMVTPASVHDSVAAREVLLRVRLMHPELVIVGADSIYAGTLVGWANSFLKLTIRTPGRPKGAVGFVPLPRRWVVERAFGWAVSARRNARDYETRPEHSEQMLTLAAITLMTRRLTRQRVYPTSAAPRPAERLQAA
ncbi:IS5 family transposase [Streptomyces venezuelae]|uniref:IS5 family transposase n=1 Tax=Streptomyces venezuelae TaxID=54571 RepID=UPI00343CC87C